MFDTTKRKNKKIHTENDFYWALMKISICLKIYDLWYRLVPGNVSNMEYKIVQSNSIFNKCHKSQTFGCKEKTYLDSNDESTIKTWARSIDRQYYF